MAMRKGVRLGFNSDVLHALSKMIPADAMTQKSRFYYHAGEQNATATYLINEGGHNNDVIGFTDSFFTTTCR